ncbi:PASTA domain-containing protein [Streptomyces sp. NRRL B-24484]|uniref:PASTA domain-containing protein n=1 Tax=Streptomyces sp. NRRL B-24484 TaxID=1463833 RepID=UPI0004BF77ED|nr:PASTA domain-containing protein [Streptomyces sp. NRRL B-24484]
MTPPLPDGRPDSGPGQGSDSDFGRTLIQAMNGFAGQAPAPVFDAGSMVRRTRRRRTLLAVAASAAAVAVLAGWAFALPHGGGLSRTPPASGPSTTTSPLPASGTSSPAPTGSPSAPGHGTPPRPGGPPVPVPIVVGTDRAQAEAVLAAVGLKPEVRLLTDRSKPTGTVIASQPAAGTVVTPGTTVRLSVTTDHP